MIRSGSTPARGRVLLPALLPPQLLLQLIHSKIHYFFFNFIFKYLHLLAKANVSIGVFSRARCVCRPFLGLMLWQGFGIQTSAPREPHREQTLSFGVGAGSTSSTPGLQLLSPQVTTDLRHRCTDGHTGTSVSAPMVAGIIALALEAK